MYASELIYKQPVPTALLFFGFYGNFGTLKKKSRHT